jgi:hypothetical protein
LLILPLAAIVLMRVSILFLVPQGGNLLTDWHGHFSYLPPFLAGFALAGSRPLWAALNRCLASAALVALACGAVLLWAEESFPAGHLPGHGTMLVIFSASAAMGWAAPLALAALAERYLNHDSRLRPIAAEAVFPFYILHQTVIVLVGFGVRPLAIGAGAQFAIILASTICACVLFYLVGRKLRWLRPLIGLSRLPVAGAIRPLPAIAAAP